MTPFNKIFESCKALTIFIMSFISSFEITKVAVPESYFLFWTPPSIAEEAAVRPNKPSSFMTDFHNGNPVFNNGPRSLPRNHPH